MSEYLITEQNGITVLKLSGFFFTDEDSEKIRFPIEDKIKDGINKMVIDLENVSILGSISLGVLVRAHTNFIKNNGKLVLCNIKSKSVQDVLNITKLGSIFSIADSLDEAVDMLH